MTAVDPVAPPAADFPPVMPLTIGSLALVLCGGIFMASSFPAPPALTVPVTLLVASVLLWGLSVLLLARYRGFAWHTFYAVARWALLAYALIAAMIEFSFVHNHAGGAPLLVISLLLVMFALDVTLSIASTVARFATPLTD